MHTFSRHVRSLRGAIAGHGILASGNPELELTALHAELKALQEDYLALGCRASLLAIERDTAFQALNNTRAYVAFVCPDCLADSGQADRGAPIGGEPADRNAIPGRGTRQEEQTGSASDDASRRRVLDNLKAYLTPQNRLLESESLSARQEIAALTRGIQELTERLKQLTLQRDSAHRALNELSRIAEMYPLQAAASQTLQDTVSADSARLASVSEKLSRAQLEKNDVSILLAESQDRVSGLLLAEQSLREEIGGLDKRLSDSETEKAGAQRKAAELADELGGTREALQVADSAHRDQVDALRQDIAAVQGELETAREQAGLLRTRLAESQDRVSGLLLAEQTLREEIDGLDKRLSDSETEKTGAQRKAQELADELDRKREALQVADTAHRDQIDALRRRIAAVQGELDTVREQVALLRVTLTETQSERDTAREHLANLDHLLRDSQSRLEEREGQLVELRAEAERQRADIHSIGQRLSGAEQAGTIAEEKVQFLLADVHKVRADSEQARRVHQRETDTLQQRLAELDTSLAAARRTIENLELSLAAAACREEIQDKHSAALEQALADYNTRDRRTAGTDAGTPVSKPVPAGEVSVDRHPGHFNWTKIATGFVVLVGVLVSLARLRDIDNRDFPRAGISSQGDAVATGQFADHPTIAGQLPPAAPETPPAVPETAATPHTLAVAPETPEPAADVAGIRPATPASSPDAAETAQPELPGRTELAVVDVFSGITQQDKVRSSGSGPTVYAYLMGVGDGANDTYDGCLQRGGTERECAFLENNMLEEGIIRLSSGVQYKVVRNGSGGSPGPDDTVQVDFRGMLLDGTEFDSSRRRGGISRFRVDEAIPGLQDVLQAMEEGGRWEVYVPTELAFRQPSPFSGQTVVFDIELVAIEGLHSGARTSQQAPVVNTTSLSAATAHETLPGKSAESVPDDNLQPATEGAPLWEQVEARTRRFLEENARRPDVVTLPSGLQYKVIGRGDGGGQMPRETDTVVLHYRGTFPDGREFESSREDGGPVTFSMQEVAPGWKEALLQMQVGDSWELYLPPALAQDSETRLLGTRGQQALIYEIELLGIQ